MSTQAEIIASPGDGKITVTIKKVYREISANIVATDFENPILLLSGDGEGKDIELNPYLITDSAKGVLGTMKDNTSIVIDNLENFKGYAVSYYQKGLEYADTTLTGATYRAVYPHPAPLAPEIYVGTTGEPSSNFYNGYRLHIKLNDYDHTLPDTVTEKVDKVEYVFIRYTRLTGTVEEKKMAVVSLDSLVADDLSAINFIRTNGYYEFPNNTLVKDAEYSFTVTTKSDGVSSPLSNTVKGLMKKVAQEINSFTLTHDNNKRNEVVYSFNVNRAALTNNDSYKLYKQVLSGDSFTETLIEDISSGRIIFSSNTDTSGNVSGNISGTLGQIIQLRVEPYSEAKILGVERLSNSIMLEGLKNNMVEINLNDITVKDGEGNATLVFRTSHRKEELPYASRNIDLTSLTNNHFDLYLPNKTSRLTQKLTLADDGTASIAIFMKGKTPTTDPGITNIFTLDASGYNAVYSQAATTILRFNSSSIKLLTTATISKSFNFDVTTARPPTPTIIDNKFLENNISVRWSSANVTSANAPTEYIVRLRNNNGYAFTHRVETITNGDEYFIFKDNIPKLFQVRYTSRLTSYTVSVVSRNSAGESLAASVTDTLEDEYFPPTYLENLRITEPSPRSTTSTRNYEGKIKINKDLWGGAFEKLTIKNNNEFGGVDGGFTPIDISSNALIPTGVEDEYKFNFSLTGIQAFYLQINAATLSSTANGIALTARTSLPLFNTVVSIDKPRIMKVTFTNDNNKTYYEVRVAPQGTELPSVSITPVPVEDAEVPANLNLIASYVKTYANLDHLYKIEFPFEVLTTSISGVTHGSESTIASNSRGSDRFGKMFGNDALKYSIKGAMDRT